MIKARALCAVLLASLAMLAVSGCGGRPPRQEEQAAAAVEAVRVTRSDIAATVSVTGTVRALRDVSLSPKNAGRVTRVPFREGDRVAKGAVLIQQDTSDIRNEIRNAEAGVASARARLAQARTESGRQDITSVTSVRQAEESLASAREQLSILRQGARPQERRRAEAAVASAQASFDNARKDLERARELFREGAIANSSLDAQEQAYQVAEANLQAARENLSLVQEGPRPEEIRVAENEVRAAEQRLRQAKADASRSQVSEDEVRAAEAALKQTQARLSSARQALADASTRSPIAGVVASRRVEPGEMVMPGSTSLIRVYDPASIFFEAAVSEVEVDDVRQGQPVEVRSQSVPGRVFSGRVAEVYPAADVVTRSFKARISLPVNDLLKPGMFAKGRIVTEQHQNQLVIPQDALLGSRSGEYVFIVRKDDVRKPAPIEEGKRPDPKAEPKMVTVEADVARRREIVTGLRGDSLVEVLSGLTEGQRVVSVGKDYLSDGQEVRIVNPSEKD